MKETIKSIILWHEQTFPDATLEGQLQKYKDEQQEWEETDCKDITELADMFIVACGIARFDLYQGIFCISDVFAWSFNFNIKKFLDTVNKKMQINRKRKWGCNKGYYQHVDE